jgi:hypothetical protein
MERFLKTRFILIICLTFGLGFALSSVVQAQGDQGCGPGFWKQDQHVDFWVNNNPDDLFSSAFGVGIEVKFKEKGTQGKPPLLNDPTLIQALQAKGGKVNALARQAVAALLNAESPDVAYSLTPFDVISLFQAAVASPDPSAIESLKDNFETLNELVCPLNEDEI